MGPDAPACQPPHHVTTPLHTQHELHTTMDTALKIVTKENSWLHSDHSRRHACIEAPVANH
jgi:hypothetical protein